MRNHDVLFVDSGFDMNHKTPLRMGGRCVHRVLHGTVIAAAVHSHHHSSPRCERRGQRDQRARLTEVKTQSGLPIEECEDDWLAS